jgi:hypothetical protein
MAAVDEYRAVVGVKPLCAALAVSRETYYRRTRSRKAGRRRRRPRPARALNGQERVAVLELLCSERFVDRWPPEVYRRNLHASYARYRRSGFCVQ